MQIELKYVILTAALFSIPGITSAATINYNRDRSDASTSPEPEEASVYLFTNSSSGDAAVPSNSSLDLANGITPTLVSGTGNAAGSVTKLTNGSGASSADDPGNNFFFNDQTGGRIAIDLSSLSTITQVNTYSWHHGDGARAPQHYTLYAAAGTETGFVADSAAADPTTQGYALIASVDSATHFGITTDPSQQGVSINPSGAATSLGNYRYFLFDVPSQNQGTFYSEIDIVGSSTPEPATGAMIGLACASMLARRRR